MASKLQGLRDALGLVATPGRLEAVGQGAFGAGDEIGAALQGLLSKANGGEFGETYRQARTENRDILDRQRAAEPYLTPAIEAVSGAVATAPLAGAKLLTSLKDVGTLAQMGGGAVRSGIPHLMKAVAPVGALFGAGGSRGESLGEVAGDAAVGAAEAAGTAGVLKGGANAALKMPAVRNVVAKMARKATNSKIRGMMDEGGDVIEELEWTPGTQRQILDIGKAQHQAATRTATPSSLASTRAEGALVPELAATVAGRLRRR